jgi:hypothetical protein
MASWWQRVGLGACLGRNKLAARRKPQEEDELELLLLAKDENRIARARLAKEQARRQPAVYAPPAATAPALAPTQTQTPAPAAARAQRLPISA